MKPSVWRRHPLHRQAGDDEADRAGKCDRQAQRGRGGDGIVDLHVAPGHERHREEAAARADHARDEPDRTADAEEAGLARQLPCWLGLAVEQHLRGRERDEGAEERGQPGGRHAPDDLRTDQRTGDDAGCEAEHDAPPHGTVAVVLAGRRDRGEHDRRSRRRDCHVHDVVDRESLSREDQREERHQRHPAADAEEPGEEADDRAQRDEDRDEHGVHVRNSRGRAAGRPSTRRR